MKLLLLSLVFVAGVSSSKAMAAAGDTCATLSELHGYTVVDDTHLVYNSDFHGKYLFTVTAGCDFKFADTIGFKPFSSFEVCSGDEMMTYEQPIGQTGWCIISSITAQ